MQHGSVRAVAEALGKRKNVLHFRLKRLGVNPLPKSQLARPLDDIRNEAERSYLQIVRSRPRGQVMKRSGVDGFARTSIYRRFKVHGIPVRKPKLGNAAWQALGE